MELLFTDNTGTDELKSLLGFIDIDLPYENIKSKIITATNEVINVIGKATYDLAVVEYQAENGNADFIFAVRNAIAIQAYRKYAPHNDLSHTNNGRLSRLEEHQKSPFQWQIDKDDAALERSYYEALDNLIKYLDVSLESWKETPQYKSTHRLFISSAFEFDEFFPIGNSRLLLLKLAPGLRRCEQKEIKSRLGKTLFDALKEDSSTQADLVYKIQEATVYYSLAWAMRRLSVQLFPEGVLQGYKSDRIHGNASKSAENNEAYQVAAYFEIDYREALVEIEQMVYEINKEPTDVQEPITFNPDTNDKFLSL